MGAKSLSEDDMAFYWQARGQRFDSAILHREFQRKTEAFFFSFINPSVPQGYRPNDRGDTRVAKWDRL